MAKKKTNRVRVEFRKKHQQRVRQGDLTRDFRDGDRQDQLADVVQSERLNGKGQLTRKRTVTSDAMTVEVTADSQTPTSLRSSADGAAATTDPGTDAGDSLSAQSQSDVGLVAASDRLSVVRTDADRAGAASSATSSWLSGRVVSVHGLRSRVVADDGQLYLCTVRQVLKSFSIDQRNVITTGDRVAFSCDPLRRGDVGSGVIERVEPRYGVLSRNSRNRQHMIAANVDYLLIVVSCAQPGIKPALIDRYLLTAEQYGIQPIICLNKADLVDLADFQALVGVYSQLGYRTLLTSRYSGLNIDLLQALLQDRQTVLAGQSGVGKSSLLNAIEPELGLRVNAVSQENDKGRHTTTHSTLIPLRSGGAVIDTPGIRQFQLWDISAAEVAGLMPDLRPHVSQCRYPNCLHLHEDECAVKDAVMDGRIDARRYDAYCHLLEEDLGL